MRRADDAAGLGPNRPVVLSHEFALRHCLASLETCDVDAATKSLTSLLGAYKAYLPRTTVPWVLAPCEITPTFMHLLAEAAAERAIAEMPVGTGFADLERCRLGAVGMATYDGGE